ncbi:MULTISPECIES: hypothetical protein [unclassified Microcoleus]|uniref:hypothetical protein n=1 Tax=unclassified Microcoleus TaxID=2642155 RepID=UPI002FD489FE
MALSAQWCGDTARIVLVAESKGNKRSVSIAERQLTGAIAEKTQHRAALFPQETELLKIVKILPLIALTYLEQKHSRCRAL